MVERRPEYSPGRVSDLLVPEIRQKHSTWCGLASVSMALQYWDYDKTPEGLYRDIYGNYVESHESSDSVKKPTLESLGVRVRRLDPQPPLAPLTSQIFKYEQMQAWIERGNTPREFLEHFVVLRKIPCIIRIPGHTMVVRGIDYDAEKYIINNPANDAIKVKRPFADIEEQWAAPEVGPDDAYKAKYPGDTRYLMLAIYPQGYNWKALAAA